MVNEIRNLSRSVDSFDPCADGICHGVRAAREDPNFADVAVLLLDELQEGGHVWSTEMIDCFQTSEHGPAAQPLEMILTNVEHCSSQVEFVEELSDENVHF